MKPELRFEMLTMNCADLGEEASVPDMGANTILQNNLTFELGEEEEIYQGYGTKDTAFPYRQYTTYTRKLKEKEVKTAVLENDNLKAVFLPESGGRLWSLIDKNTGKNLLYTNDVLRYSNLATRNAWFSGGVEWNIGIIGHTPFTTEPIFTAELENEKKNPVLRMYMYERIREVEYQMDFWLDEEDTALNCRMRILNSTNKVLPMYWWSNIAVPEFEGGRLVVPAKEAYSCVNYNVKKVAIPYVDGVDISHYEDIPLQIDYFFDIPKDAPKYIVNLDADGYGLAHVSTSRLRSRKLFSWGHNEGSDRWQEFLTKDAGKYVEIQAGLGKTQYGCIPMSPCTAWEWIEQYGPIQVTREEKDLPYEELEKIVTNKVKATLEEKDLEQLLQDTKKLAKTKGKLVYKAAEHGALKNLVRKLEGEHSLSEHLDYGLIEDPGMKKWAHFLETGEFWEQDPEQRPADFQCDDFVYHKLQEAILGDEVQNWYAYYQSGLMDYDRGDVNKAELEFLASYELQETAWNLHALAALYLKSGEYENAVIYMMRGIQLRNNDLSYVKEGFRIMLAAEGEKEVLMLFKKLPDEIKNDSRIRYDRIVALKESAQIQEAYDLLMSDPDFVLDDIREGEDSIGGLYKELYQDLYGKMPEEVPNHWNFEAIV